MHASPDPGIPGPYREFVPTQEHGDEAKHPISPNLWYKKHEQTPNDGIRWCYLKPRNFYKRIFRLSFILFLISGWCLIEITYMTPPRLCIFQFPDGAINNGYLISDSPLSTNEVSPPDVILTHYDDTCSYSADELESLAYNQEIKVGPFSIIVSEDDRVFVNSEEVNPDYHASYSENHFVFPIFQENQIFQVHYLGFAEGYKFNYHNGEYTSENFEQPILVVGILSEDKISSIIPVVYLTYVGFLSSLMIIIWSVYKLRSTRKGHWGL